MSGNQRKLDLQMKIAFCSTNPSLTRFPHCIFYNDGYPTQIIADMLHVPVGVWGDRCLVDADGEPYLEPDDSRIIEEFELWTLPENQEYARRFTGKACGFTMVIAASTAVDILQDSYDFADDQDQEFYYETYITRIAGLLPALGWAYIPLEHENEYAMFVTSKENSHYIAEFRRRLTDAGNTKFFDVSVAKTEQRWNGPVIWNA